MKIKHEFFEKGVDNQKTPTIVVSFKTPPLDKMEKWSAEQKTNALEFAESVKKDFDRFYNKITTQCGNLTNWLSFNENGDELNRIIELDGDCLLKFNDGRTCNYNSKNYPLAIVTHFKRLDEKL